MASEGITLDVKVDNTIDITNLREEMQMISPLIYRWTEGVAKAEEEYDIACATYEELRSSCYIIEKQKDSKASVDYINAIVDSNITVMGNRRRMFKAKRDFKTIKGYVSSLLVKKDMLIQLSADVRKNS